MSLNSDEDVARVVGADCSVAERLRSLDPFALRAAALHRSVLRRMPGRYLDWGDLVAAARLGLWRALVGLDGGRVVGDVSRFLCTAARNSVRDLLRSAVASSGCGDSVLSLDAMLDLRSEKRRTFQPRARQPSVVDVVASRLVVSELKVLLPEFSVFLDVVFSMGLDRDRAVEVFSGGCRRSFEAVEARFFRALGRLQFCVFSEPALEALRAEVVRFGWGGGEPDTRWWDRREKRRAYRATARGRELRLLEKARARQRRRLQG